MKHLVKIKQRDIKESLIEITFFPQTEKEKSIIADAKIAALNEQDHKYLNDLLIGICLNNNFTPVAPAGDQGNSFFLKVLN